MEMAASDTESVAAKSCSSQGNRKNSLADVERVRKEIQQLQERRAAAMMSELAELQRERDTAVGRVKLLKETVEGKC